jgi:hypothetical protein
MAAPRKPQDRKTPTARKRAPAKAVQRKPTAAEMAASEAADATTGLRTEVEVEETGWITVPWGDLTFRIRPGQEWRQSTNDALNEGSINDWAEAVMPADDYEAWLDLDPTNAEFGAFMQAMGEEVGAGLGESGPSNRALRRMRRR